MVTKRSLAILGFDSVKELGIVQEDVKTDFDAGVVIYRGYI